MGLISASVSMFAALDKPRASGNVMVCDLDHEPTQIRQPRVCPTHGEVPFQQLKKARPVDDGLVVLEAEDLDVLAEVANRFKKKADVTVHPAEQVEVLTAVGEKMYHLTPEPGHEAAYTTLLALVTNHPELAFMARWTPRSSVGQFRLRQYGGVLVLQERVNAANVREAPEVALERNDQLVALAEQVLTVGDYDPAVYMDDVESRLADLIKGRPVVGKSDTSTTVAATNVSDLMEKLAAQVASTKKPTRSRKKVSA